VQTADGEELFARHDSLKLKGQGLIGVGRLPEQGSPHTMLTSPGVVYEGSSDPVF
jgi:hypothetical protein